MNDSEVREATPLESDKRVSYTPRTTPEYTRADYGQSALQRSTSRGTFQVWTGTLGHMLHEDYASRSMTVELMEACRECVYCIRVRLQAQHVTATTHALDHPKP